MTDTQQALQEIAASIIELAHPELVPNLAAVSRKAVEMSKPDSPLGRLRDGIGTLAAEVARLRAQVAPADFERRIGKVVISYIDRMGDVCDEDPAARILTEFVAAVTPIYDEWSKAGWAKPEQTPSLTVGERVEHIPASPRTEFVLSELRSSLNAMLTFFGMDEDENNREVFDKARQAYNYAEIVMRPLEPWERQSLEEFRTCAHRWHEKACAKGYDGVESMCDTAPAAQAEPVARIDPMQDPMRPVSFIGAIEDETPAELVLRKLACWLGVGGYNADKVDADSYHRKIVEAVEQISKRPTPPAAPKAVGEVAPHPDVVDWYSEEPPIGTRLYTSPPSNTAAQGVGKLWLWKNFVDGRPEYWAFDNPFPVHMDGGDPQTLGEPCGYAIFKPSRQGRTDVPEAEVLRRIRETKPA